MYKTFLSWRYLITRRTNLIGTVGVFVAVAALIMILSIMTGFLEQTRAMVRGGLADVVVVPPPRIVKGPRSDEDLARILTRMRSDGRIASASPRIVWPAFLGQGGEGTAVTEKTFSDPKWGGRAFVRLVGVDVHGATRLAGALLEAQGAALGMPVRAPRVWDELDTSGLRAALEREPHADRRAAPVASAQFPFALPATYDPEGRRKAGAVLGEQLYSSLGLARGDEFEVVSGVPDAEGDLAVIKRAFVVAGTFRTKDNEMDGRRIYVPRSELADMLNDGRDYTEIVARLANYESEATAVVAELESDLAEAGLIDIDPRTAAAFRGQVRTWEDFRASLIGAIENERVLMAIMLSLILVVAGFTIFSILTMMVTEKRRDIGILAAVGATPQGVLSTFLLIGFWNALVGSALGAVVGIAGALNIDSIEQWLSSALGIEIFNRDVYYFDTIPAHVEVLPVALIVGGAFLCTLLFAAIPAWRAARLHPLDALRYE